MCQFGVDQWCFVSCLKPFHHPFSISPCFVLIPIWLMPLSGCPSRSVRQSTTSLKFRWSIVLFLDASTSFYCSHCTVILFLTSPCVPFIPVLTHKYISVWFNVFQFTNSLISIFNSSSYRTEWPTYLPSWKEYESQNLELKHWIEHLSKKNVPLIGLVN